MQQLLPEIFEDRRAIPNCFLRGALFGMVRKGRRALVESQPIVTMSQYKVSFSGSCKKRGFFTELSEWEIYKDL